MIETAKLFHKLNKDAGEDLEEGVEKIKKEEAAQSMSSPCQTGSNDWRKL